jgi:hypothetical protein
MIAQTATRIRAQIDVFSGNLSQGLCKVARRLACEVIYGVLARRSVHLTEIGRSLEEPIPLIKTENRLSRNLARPEIRPVVQAAMAREGASRVSDDTLLVLDLSDIAKPYARKMEHLARVRDGSKKELADGYWLCQVIGVEEGGSEIAPLYGDLYSQEAPGFVSENEEIFRALRTVSGATSGRGIWVMDRGGDRGEIFAELAPPAKQKRFLIRLQGDRHLLCGTRKRPALAIAESCPTPYATAVWREEPKRERAVTVEYGYRRVRLPAHPETELWLVVVKGFGAKPLMLLTNVPMRRNRGRLWWAVSSYLTRWRVEETLRFAKQCYRLEDVRVRGYERLRNLYVLATAATAFCCTVLGQRLSLRVLARHVLAAAKRVLGVPDFRYYAIGEGLSELLTRFPRKRAAPPRYPTAPTQLSLLPP